MKLFIKYIGLSVLGTVGVSCYILADTYFISKGMGTAGLAALNICIPAYSIVYGIGLMFGVGGATKYNILKERGIPERKVALQRGNPPAGIRLPCPAPPEEERPQKREFLPALFSAPIIRQEKEEA